MKAIQNPVVTYLNELSIFNALDAKERSQLAAHAEKVIVKKANYLYELGDPSNSIYFLAKGTIKLGYTGHDDREVIKRVVYPGTMFGELSLLGEGCRQEFAMSMNEDAELYRLDAKVINLLMQHNHQLTLNLLDWIGQRLKKTEAKLESMVFKDARARVIDFLKETARCVGKKIGYELLIKHCFTQQDIANITGTSRQTVTAVLNELKKANLIHFNRRSILIRDLSKLA